MQVDTRWLVGFYTPGGKIPLGKDGVYVWGERDEKLGVVWRARPVTVAEAQQLAAELAARAGQEAQGAPIPHGSQA